MSRGVNYCLKLKNGIFFFCQGSLRKRCFQECMTNKLTQEMYECPPALTLLQMTYSFLITRFHKINKVFIDKNIYQQTFFFFFFFSGEPFFIEASFLLPQTFKLDPGILLLCSPLNQKDYGKEDCFIYSVADYELQDVLSEVHTYDRRTRRKIYR